MAKKKQKPNKRAKAKIQKAATRKPVVRLTKRELARVQKAHAKPKVMAPRSPLLNFQFIPGEPLKWHAKGRMAIVIIAGQRAQFKEPWIIFLAGPHIGKKLRWDGKPLAKIIADYEANPPTTRDEAAARNLGRD